MDNDSRYDEIINLSHRRSDLHPPLGKESYAAQFMPFESLTGYDLVVDEAARVTDARVYIDEDEKIRLSEMLTEIIKHKDEKPHVIFTYFVEDKEKEGGEFVNAEGTVKKYREEENRIVMDDGTLIPVDAITDIKCDLFG